MNSNDNNTNHIAKMIVKGIFMTIFVTGLIAFAVWVTMSLWNWLLPSIFVGAVTTITYWQAFGLLLLCKILFGNWGGGKGKHKKHCCHGKYNWKDGGDGDHNDMKCGSDHWKSKFRKKMETMSDEDKAKMKDGLGNETPTPSDAQPSQEESTSTGTDSSNAPEAGSNG
jgi:hypothetical protein